MTQNFGRPLAIQSEDDQMFWHFLFSIFFPCGECVFLRTVFRPQVLAAH